MARGAKLAAETGFATQAYTRTMAEILSPRAARGVAAVAAVICLGAALIACGGSNAAVSTPTPAEQASSVTAVTSATSATVVSATASTPFRSTAAASTPTPTEAASGRAGEPITFSTGSHLLASDLAARGVGEPGRGPFTGERLIIPSIRVDAPLVAVKVGADGSMPSPPSLTEVAWYDFSGMPSLGGSPGNGGNVVLAGDAGRTGVGLGVFSALARAAPGDFVLIRLTGGEVCYRIEFNKLAFTTEVDFGVVVRATAEESVTLITAGASADSRTVVWGRRTSCADAPTATPTPTPPVGHFRVRIVAENYQFTVVEGATIPKGFSSIDVTLELRDSGVKHGLEIFAPAGGPVSTIDPVEGPTTTGTSFLVGLPELAGRYTFQCPVHPQMTGWITVEAP